MSILKIAAFADGDVGGNPAGVSIMDVFPSDAQMQSTAAQVGFSETVFAVKKPDGAWRVRYFSPESEVPFCGHATIALGAALAMEYGAGQFDLEINRGMISVEGRRDGSGVAATLQSPPTHSEGLAAESIAELLSLFSYSESDLDLRIPPARIHGGADHFVFALKSRDALARMHYDLNAGRQFMRQAGIATVMLVFAETEQRFHSRNLFASSGVYEDPATGAATAAFAGYLRDVGWPHGGTIEITQGEDMGMRSRLSAQISAEPGASIRVSGRARLMLD